VKAKRGIVAALLLQRLLRLYQIHYPAGQPVYSGVPREACLFNYEKFTFGCNPITIDKSIIVDRIIYKYPEGVV